MISFYGYEELDKEVQQTIQDEIMQTQAWHDYLGKFQQDKLMEFLEDYYAFESEDDIVTIHYQNYDILVTARVSMTNCYFISVTIHNYESEIDYNKLLKQLEGDLINTVIDCRLKVRTIVSDFAQYVQDYVFTKEGKKLK